MKRVATALVALAGAAAAAALGAAAFVWSGVYDISAASAHTQAVYTLLQVTGERSIRWQARAIVEPPLGDPALAVRGAVCYRDKCIACHGGPGVPQDEAARSMQPLPGPLVDATQRFRARELYWVIRDGIKMSGMPAWGHRLAEADHWALVAFLQRLPQLTAPAFKAAIDPAQPGTCRAVGAATSARAADRAASIAGPAVDASTDRAALGAAERGRRALSQYACNGCHRIPGVTGADVHVGPPLAGLARRGLVAGRLANGPDALVEWIRDPQRIDPLTTMPNMAVTEPDARDIAAYLGTLY